MDHSGGVGGAGPMLMPPPPPSAPNVNAAVDTGTGPNGVALDQATIQQIVSGLQQASIMGATQLPSRDIPQQTLPRQSDAAVQPNYIPGQPSPSSASAAAAAAAASSMATAAAGGVGMSTWSMDALRMPILVALLYFLSQLPVVKRLTQQWLPFGFRSDGTCNFYGFVAMSLLFSASYACCERLLNDGM